MAILLSLSHPHALSAFTHSDVVAYFYAQIISSVGMALRAMGLGGMASRNGIPSKKVNPGFHWLKMIWIHAKSVSAEMIQVQAFRNRSNVKFVTKAVSIEPCSHRFANGVGAVGHGGGLDVPSSQCAFPDPAAIGFFHLLHKQRSVAGNYVAAHRSLFLGGEGR